MNTVVEDNFYLLNPFQYGLKRNENNRSVTVTMRVGQKNVILRNPVRHRSMNSSFVM